MTPEDVLCHAPIVQFGISRDGRWIYAVVRHSSADGIHLSLRFRDLDGDRWRSGAGDGAEIIAPAIANDSARWAGLLRSPGGYRVVLGRLSAPAQPPIVLRGPRQPRVLKWAHDDSLSCLGEDADGATRVWRWPAPERQPDAAPDWVTDHRHPVVDYAWHPSAPRLAWLDRLRPAQPFDLGRTRLLLGSLAPTEPVELPCPGYAFGYLSWSPDGRWLALSARPADAPLAPAGLWLIDPETPRAPIELTAGMSGTLGGYDWAPDSRSLVAALEQGTEGKLYRLAPDTAPAPLGPPGFLSDPRLDRRDGRMIFLRQTVDTPQRIGLLDQGTHQDLDDHSRGRHSRGRTLRWESEGECIEGVLLTPDGDGPWPALIWAHGGPAHHISETFSPYFQVLAGAGYAVLAPNYRGSTGRGRAFCEAGVGALGTADVADLRAGIDQIVDLGVADPDRIGVIGWSYGGSLALALARDEPRVRAVAAGAAVADWVGLLGASTFPATAWRYLGSLPWVDRGPWDAASPVSWIDRVNAPTLLLHGTEDAAVPFAQSLILYRLLLARGVPCELAWYRGEGHTLASPVAVVDMLRQLLAWFERHLAQPV